MFFPDRVFHVTIADADIGSLKSLHTLFDKYLDHILGKFEQNGIVRNNKTFKLFDKKKKKKKKKKKEKKKKMINHFDKAKMPFLKDVFVTERIS